MIDFKRIDDYIDISLSRNVKIIDAKFECDICKDEYVLCRIMVDKPVMVTEHHILKQTGPMLKDRGWVSVENGLFDICPKCLEKRKEGYEKARQFLAKEDQACS